MSELDQVIKVTITRNTTQPSQVGFGTPMIFSSDPFYNPVAGTEWGSEKVRAYSDLTGVAADFETTTKVYKKARSIFSQNPRPTLVKIGTRPSAAALDASFTPTDLTEGATSGFAIGGVLFTVEVPPSAAVSDIVTLLAALVPPAGYTFTDSTSTLDITATDAGVTQPLGLPIGGDLADDTADAGGVGADYTAIRNYDDDWYLVVMDSTGDGEILALADEVEASQKLYLAETVDADVPDTPVTGDASVASQLATFDRTALTISYTADEFASGWAGRVLPEGAGTVNWAYQSIAGVVTDSWNATQLNNLIGPFEGQGKRVNVNTTMAAVNVTRYGTVGSGEYIDTIRGTDRLTARLQERLFAILANSSKIPYTDSGIQRIRAEVLGQLQEEVNRGFLAAEPAPTCDVPLAAAVPAADKANRVLNSVVFRATYAGAINKIALEGELSI